MRGKSRTAKVVVVGAGLSGLAAACHLRGAGHEVLVLERDDVVGGRADTWRSDGYRFDTGPVVMTMPELLAEPFAALGADLADAVPMRLVFMVLVDGWLTKLSDPIVLYAPSAILGVRAPWDIPVEDFAFGFSMCTMTLLLWRRRVGGPPAPLV